MRAPLSTCLFFFFAIVPMHAWAGKLSRLRQEARNHDSETDKVSSSEEADVSSSAGKLAKARRRVRPKRVADGDHQHQSTGHRPRRVRHFDSPGCLPLSGYGACCPPAVVIAPTAIAPPVLEPYVYEPYIQEPVAPNLPSPATSFARLFPAYPYADGCDGCLLTTSSQDCFGCGKSWSGRIQFELGSDFDGVDRSGVTFLLEGRYGFGFDFDWDMYTEELPDGGHDELHIGQLNLLYRVVESDHVLMRVGVGASWLGDKYDTDLGANFTIQADYLPRRPYVFSGELDFGTLGDAQTIHAAFSAGVMFNRCELYGGYDYRRIGDVEVEGPMVGLRVWY